MNHKSINAITGWGVFLFATIVYILTMAPTASFWDCGEFIACANELEVPHPPGAPFYLLLGRLFAILSFGNAELVPYMVNIMSVLSSSFTVLFIFWTITMLAKKMIVPKDKEPDMGQTIAMMFAGLVGALACTFSESFWFNAVEAEVYAMSSVFTAAVVWLIFKWEEKADEPHNLRFLVLIAFIMGVSIGVHLLNLLTIPALAFVVYFRKFKANALGVILTAAISIFILAAIQYGLIQLTVDIAWGFEKIFTGVQEGAETSGMGLPHGTGAFIFLILLAALNIGLIWISLPRTKWMDEQGGFLKKMKPIVNTIALCALVISIGYSSYAMIVIRANASPVINENDPSNVLTLISYLKREQYGERPLATGPLYNNTNRYTLEQGDPNYQFVDSLDRYLLEGYKQDVQYGSEVKVLFPRMWSQSHYNNQPHGYKNYVEDRGFDAQVMFDDNPTQSENYKFFFNYQIKHMYLRYFMWNFVGREGDSQDMTWESGLEFGKISKMPESIRDHQGKNHYFFLPLLLGLFGLVWQFITKPKDGTIMLMLFFFTGLAIIIYLNQTPSQPRERDYSYVGSFQTFCIWIGLGVIGIYELLRPLLKKSSGAVAGAACLIVPLIMGFQNWDDHTRHQRYVAPDSAYNLLNSCEENAILFTNGDNDTFPLWYIQEVEDVRTDVRVVNLSLLNTDWYIDQMRDQANESPGLPITLPERDWKGDNNSVKPFPSGQEIQLKVDKDQLIQNGVVDPAMADKILPTMPWKIRTRGGKQNSYLYKQDLIIMDIMMNNANAGWPRPIYFSSTIPPSSYMNLTDYFYVEGLAYRVKPLAKPKKNPNDPYSIGFMDKEMSYQKIVKEFKYRELDNPNLYVDEHIRRTIIGNMRSTIFRTANAFVDDATKLENQNARLEAQIAQMATAGANADSLQAIVDANKPEIERNKSRAKEILDFSMERMPDSVIEMEPIMMLFCGNAFQRMGDMEGAVAYYDKVEKKVYETVKYYHDIDEPYGEEDRYLSALQMLMQYYSQAKMFERGAQIADKMFDLTNDPQMKDYGDQLRSMVDTKPAPLPGAGPANSPAEGGGE